MAGRPLKYKYIRRKQRTSTGESTSARCRRNVGTKIRYTINVYCYEEMNKYAMHVLCMVPQKRVWLP